MKVLAWGDKYPFSEYVINRYCNLFENIVGVDTDLEDFIEFLSDHHSDNNPLFPDDLVLEDHWSQLYVAFKDQIGEVLLCLNSRSLNKVSKMEEPRKALLASELIIMQYLHRVGGYVFKSAHFTNLIDFCIEAKL